MYGQQRKPDAQKDTQIVVSDLVNCNVFKVVPGRKYKPFLRPKDVLNAKDKNRDPSNVNKLGSSF